MLVSNLSYPKFPIYPCNLFLIENPVFFQFLNFRSCIINRNPVFGNTRDVITKENLLEFFSVQVEFLPYLNKSSCPALSIVAIGVRDEIMDDLVRVTRITARFLIGVHSGFELS